MSTQELCSQIHQYLNQLSFDQLKIVLNVLTVMNESTSEDSSQFSSFVGLHPETVLTECPPDEFKVNRRNVTHDQLKKLVFLVSKSSGETEIDVFLKQKENLPVLAFVSRLFSTGNHGVWILPQQTILPKVGSKKGLRPDYLFGGCNSTGMDWWVLELKGANEKICVKDKDSKKIKFSAVVENGISQIKEYINFCTENSEIMRKSYGIKAFDEPKGILIVGRENEFTKDEEKQKLRRNFTRENPKIQIRTYDSLIRTIMTDGYIQYKLPWLSTAIFDFLTNEATDDYEYFN